MGLWAQHALCLTIFIAAEVDHKKNLMVYWHWIRNKQGTRCRKNTAAHKPRIKNLEMKGKEAFKRCLERLWIKQGTKPCWKLLLHLQTVPSLARTLNLRLVLTLSERFILSKWTLWGHSRAPLYLFLNILNWITVTTVITDLMHISSLNRLNYEGAKTSLKVPLT